MQLNRTDRLILKVMEKKPQLKQKREPSIILEEILSMPTLENNTGHPRHMVPTKNEVCASLRRLRGVL